MQSRETWASTNVEDDHVGPDEVVQIEPKSSTTGTTRIPSVAKVVVIPGGDLEEDLSMPLDPEREARRIRNLRANRPGAGGSTSFVDE